MKLTRFAFVSGCALGLIIIACSGSDVPKPVPIDVQNQLRAIQLAEVPVNEDIQNLQKQYQQDLQKLGPLNQRAQTVMTDALKKAGLDPNKYAVVVRDANKATTGTPGFDVSTEGFYFEKKPEPAGKTPPASPPKPAAKSKK